MNLQTALQLVVGSWCMGWAWGKLAAYIQRFMSGELFM